MLSFFYDDSWKINCKGNLAETSTFSVINFKTLINVVEKKKKISYFKDETNKKKRRGGRGAEDEEVEERARNRIYTAR